MRSRRSRRRRPRRISGHPRAARQPAHRAATLSDAPAQPQAAVVRGSEPHPERPPTLRQSPRHWCRQGRPLQQQRLEHLQRRAPKPRPRPKWRARRPTSLSQRHGRRGHRALRQPSRSAQGSRIGRVFLPSSGPKSTIQRCLDASKPTTTPALPFSSGIPRRSASVMTAPCSKTSTISSSSSPAAAPRRPPVPSACVTAGAADPALVGFIASNMATRSSGQPA
mmetsp:Transcript_167035/g.536351  ORF Transcript_167035/g.536351 Transcript_167035/m.536351 type:complete len:223 (-) Transcript_167035:274-942(-)